MWLDGCSWLTGRFLLPEWLLMSPYWNVLICEVETLCLPARLVVPVSTDWRSCLCFLSCSVPSISVQLNGSTSVSSALAGKRVTNHPSWALGLLGAGLWAGCRFHSLWCWRASFSSALVLWVSVCSGTESHKKNTTQTWNLFVVQTTGESSFNEKRGDICLLQQQTWQQARLSPESSCWTEN